MIATNHSSDLTTPPVEAVAAAISTTPSFYGWHVVAAAFPIAVFAWGTGFYGPSDCLDVVRQTRGWPIALISGAMTLHFLIGVALIPICPQLSPLWTACRPNGRGVVGREPCTILAAGAHYRLC